MQNQQSNDKSKEQNLDYTFAQDLAENSAQYGQPLINYPSRDSLKI